MDAIGQHVAQLMKQQGAFVGNDGLLLIRTIPAPQRQPDEIVVFGGWNRRQTIQSVAGAIKIASVKVVDKVRVTVPSLGSLLGGKITALRYRNSVNGSK